MGGCVFRRGSHATVVLLPSPTHPTDTSTTPTTPTKQINNKQIVVPPPDAATRLEILRSLLFLPSRSAPRAGAAADATTAAAAAAAATEASAPSWLAGVARDCVGYVAADLQALVREALVATVSSSSAQRPRGEGGVGITEAALRGAMERVGASVLRGKGLEVPHVPWSAIGVFCVEMRVFIRSLVLILARAYLTPTPITNPNRRAGGGQAPAPASTRVAPPLPADAGALLLAAALRRGGDERRGRRGALGHGQRHPALRPPGLRQDHAGCVRACVRQQCAGGLASDAGCTFSKTRNTKHRAHTCMPINP